MRYIRGEGCRGGSEKMRGEGCREDSEINEGQEDLEEVVRQMRGRRIWRR